MYTFLQSVQEISYIPDFPIWSIGSLVDPGRVFEQVVSVANTTPKLCFPSSWFNQREIFLNSKAILRVDSWLEQTLSLADEAADGLVDISIQIGDLKNLLRLFHHILRGNKKG